MDCVINTCVPSCLCDINGLFTNTCNLIHAHKHTIRYASTGSTLKSGKGVPLLKAHG